MAEINEADSIDYYNARPAKRASAGVLIFNHKDELLIVKPVYRNTWHWPGGSPEDQESPLHAAVRECHEEIGIRLKNVRAAFVDYVPKRDDGTLDVVHYVFTTDPVDNTFLENVTLQVEEISEALFVPIMALDTYMKPYRVRSVRAYLNQPKPYAMKYLEDGYDI